MDCKEFRLPRVVLLVIALAWACGSEAPPAAPAPPSADDVRLSLEREARAVEREAERAAALRVEVERLERAAQQAPAAAVAWQQSIAAARRRIMAGDYEDGDERAFGVPEGCPLSSPSCEDVEREASAARESVVPLAEWLAAVARLQAREAEIASESTLQQSTVDEWMELIHDAQARPDPCPAAVCSRARTSDVDRLAAIAERRSMSVPLPVASVSQMQLLYADLRESGRPVVLRNVSLAADTYYNCAFRSQSQWRAFRIPDGFGMGVYAYCRRGESNCEERYTMAMQGELRGQSVTLVYPGRNPICEADQVEWLTAE